VDRQHADGLSPERTAASKNCHGRQTLSRGETRRERTRNGVKRRKWRRMLALMHARQAGAHWNSNCTDTITRNTMLTEALPKLDESINIGRSALQLPGRVQTWMREALCSLQGHDLLFDFEPGRRIYLRCANCGHETPGWEAK
jgi:hypothetical protein